MMKTLRYFAAVSALTKATNTLNFERDDLDIEALHIPPHIANLTNIFAYSGERTSLGCPFACKLLSTLYGNGTLLSGTLPYLERENDFWSTQQANTKPQCIFQPSDSTHVAAVVFVSRQTHCSFAVRSGGHAAFSGASNIEGGITIDLKKLRQISVSLDKKIASLGPGNTWYDVYSSLEKEELSVIGGRVAAIGVGGLTLGGGISFFSGLYGWACDNIANYEVVTASGHIINANSTSFPDLYWALRGGGNNFGVVTRFDAYTFPQSMMWGGGRLYTINQSASLIKAFTNFGINAQEDPKAAVILSFAYAQGQYFGQADLQYALPTANPPIFDEFLTIQPTLIDTTFVRTQSNLTIEFNSSNPNGLRETYWTASFILNEKLASFILDIYIENINHIVDVPGILPACSFQVITLTQLSHMSKDGGNALGIDSSKDPILLLNWNLMWSDATRDEEVMKTQANITNTAVAKAKEWGLYKEFIYMNYASQYQNVVASYGKENVDRLRKVAKKYDPDGVFQIQQPGYFKLNGPPAGLNEL